MEKSRAIELLKLAVPIKALTQQEYADFVEAVNMGMNALEQPTSPDTIDRKAALDALRRCQTYLYDARDTELKIELSSAEAAINNLSTIQPEKEQLSQSDLISRKETIKHLQGVLDVTVPITDYDGGYVDGVEVGIRTVSTMPTIQPVATDTNVGDTISRQAAIDIERNATVDTNPSHFEAHQKFTQFMDDAEVSSFGRWQWANGFNTALTAVGIDLKKLPSAQQEPQWIPCSERMPEEHKWIGTLKFGTTISDEVYVTFENEKGERFCKHMTFQNGELSRYDQFHMDTWFKGSKPIAWMPLPEAYKSNK